jgi:hypothetical protein
MSDDSISNSPVLVVGATGDLGSRVTERDRFNLSPLLSRAPSASRIG